MHILILTTIQTRFVIYQHLVNKHILYDSLWTPTLRLVQLEPWLNQPPMTKVLQGEGWRPTLGHRLVYMSDMHMYTHTIYYVIYRILIHPLYIVYTIQIDLALLYTTIVCNMAENHIILGLYIHMYQPYICIYCACVYVCVGYV